MVFKLDTAGNQIVLYNFTGGADGGQPYAGVILDASGNLYGTTYTGGTSNAGVVFELDATGQESVLYSFTRGADGGHPYAGVIAGAGGHLFGTTYGAAQRTKGWCTNWRGRARKRCCTALLEGWTEVSLTAG